MSKRKRQNNTRQRGGRKTTTGAYGYGGRKYRRYRAGRDRQVGYYGRYAAGRELKFHDVAVDDNVVSATGQIIESINIIPQNTTEKGRVGRKCTLKSIGWKMDISLPAAADQADIPNGDELRIIMYLDKQCNGATAAVTDVLETAVFKSFNNLVNVGRFRKFYDRTIVLNRRVAATDGANTNTTPEVNMKLEFYKKCNIPLEFSSTTGAITEIRSNNLGVLLISKNAIVRFDSEVRLRFEG